jgi:hypothetical protein
VYLLTGIADNTDWTVTSLTVEASAPRAAGAGG